ncbi:MAG: hypothetical protein VYE68_03180 [Acidobacteriota bacterium]|nr:hypothetical protein [Acidobacteriota bacterium]
MVKLSEVELERGAVSAAYVEAQLHRSFPANDMFQRLLKSIWYQVSTAGEVFGVGEILDDDTVKGGMGWAVELAKHLHKPLHVYDQTKNHWYRWQDGWDALTPPTIRCSRFTGAGTCFLTEIARHAIDDLFECSFGPVSEDTSR